MGRLVLQQRSCVYKTIFFKIVSFAFVLHFSTRVQSESQAMFCFQFGFIEREESVISMQKVEIPG